MSPSKPFNITVIQVHATTTNANEAEVEWFYEDLKKNVGEDVENHSTSASSALLVGAYLDYCDTEWFALEMNRDNSVVFCDYTQVLHFGLLLTIRATPFLLGDSCPQ